MADVESSEQPARTSRIPSLSRAGCVEPASQAAAAGIHNLLAPQPALQSPQSPATPTPGCLSGEGSARAVSHPLEARSRRSSCDSHSTLSRTPVSSTSNTHFGSCRRSGIPRDPARQSSNYWPYAASGTLTPALSSQASLSASTSLGEAVCPPSPMQQHVVPHLVLPQHVTGGQGAHSRLVASQSFPDRLALASNTGLGMDMPVPQYEDDRCSTASMQPQLQQQEAWSTKSASSGILVAVRMRPLSDKERGRGDHESWGIDAQRNVGHWKDGQFVPKYHYDTVFGPEAGNHEVFDTLVRPLLAPVLQGVSATVFAYGVTSSGKTHTMMGGAHEAGVEPGLVPLAVQELFSLIERQQLQQQAGRDGSTTTTYTVKLSMMEIYNEVLNDLLEPANTNLKLREDAQRGVVLVEQLYEEVVDSPQHALQAIARGDTYRKVSATAFNEDSSRSHTICRLVVEGVTRPAGCSPLPPTPSGKHSRRRGGAPEPGARTTTAVINLIDLAGSESAKVSMSKDQRMEGSFINKSLLTLGTVINKLAAGGPGARNQQQQHIPFRDSKLTRLLQSSMTGSGARIAIVCNITPAAAQFEETNNTLKFATRAKLVRVAVSAQQTVDERALLRQYRREVKELRAQLAALLAAQQQQQQRGPHADGSHYGTQGALDLEHARHMGEVGGLMGFKCEQCGGGPSELQLRLSEVTQLLRIEREARVKAQQDAEALEVRLHGLLRLVAFDAQAARTALGVPELDTPGGPPHPLHAQQHTADRHTVGGAGDVQAAMAASAASSPVASAGDRRLSEGSGHRISPKAPSPTSPPKPPSRPPSSSGAGTPAAAPGLPRTPTSGGSQRRGPSESGSGRLLSGGGVGIGGTPSSSSILEDFSSLSPAITPGRGPSPRLNGAHANGAHANGVVPQSPSTPTGRVSSGGGALVPPSPARSQGASRMASRRSSGSSYDVDAELALLEQIHQMQDDLALPQPLPEPGWRPGVVSSGPSCPSSTRGPAEVESEQERVPSSGASASDGLRSSVGRSLLGDAEKDLEIQVLLADREVLQDQVVSVELANAALQRHAHHLAAQAATARMEADKERAAKQQMEAKMSELRAELGRLQATVQQRHQQLQQQQQLPPPGAASPAASSAGDGASPALTPRAGRTTRVGFGRPAGLQACSSPGGPASMIPGSPAAGLLPAVTRIPAAPAGMASQYGLDPTVWMSPGNLGSQQ